MDEYQKQLFDEDREQSRAFDKVAGTAAVALVTASITLWKWMPGGIVPESRWQLITCWASLGLVALSVALSHYASGKAIGQAIEDDESGLGDALETGGVFTKLTGFFNGLTIVFLVLGVVALVWFTVLNIGQLSNGGEKGNHTETTTSTSAPGSGKER